MTDVDMSAINMEYGRGGPFHYSGGGDMCRYQGY